MSVVLTLTFMFLYIFMEAVLLISHVALLLPFLVLVYDTREIIGWY